MSMGQEEPNTKPGPLYALNALVYAPSWPVFIKGGYVFGGGKDGYSVGVGIDIKLTEKWSLRLQDTYYKAQEDFNEPAEGETLLSIGLKYSF